MDALKKATELVVDPEPPPPWLTWDLEKLIRVTRRALLEYGLIDSLVVKVQFKLEATDPPGTGLNGTALTDEGTTWDVKATVIGYDANIDIPEEEEPEKGWALDAPVETSRRKFTGKGKDPTGAYLDLYTKLKASFRDEAGEFQLKHLAMLEARKTLFRTSVVSIQSTTSFDGDVEQLTTMWSASEDVEDLNLEDADDLLAWLRASGIPHDEDLLEPHYKDWVAAGKPRIDHSD